LLATEHEPAEAVVVFNIAEDRFYIKEPLLSPEHPYFTF
jgi:hypothetical protein